MSEIEDRRREREKLAKSLLHPVFFKDIQEKARTDAEHDRYDAPIRTLDDLAEHAYAMAWSRKRDKLARTERDAGDEHIAAVEQSTKE